MSPDLLQSHLVALLLFSWLSATALAVIYRRPGRRLRFGLKVFLAFTLGTLAGAWLMAAVGR